MNKLNRVMSSERSKIARKAAHERSHPHPLRSKIQRWLRVEGPTPLATLSERLKQSRSVVHYHVFVLESYGLARCRRDGVVEILSPSS